MMPKDFFMACPASAGGGFAQDWACGCGTTGHWGDCADRRGWNSVGDMHGFFTYADVYNLSYENEIVLDFSKVHATSCLWLAVVENHTTLRRTYTMARSMLYLTATEPCIFLTIPPKPHASYPS